MKNKLRVGVVGAGYFGSRHASNYAAIAPVELAYVCDLVEERARAVAAEHGGAPVVDYRELFGKVDAVSIAVPTNAHFPVARDFLDSGIHVLLEKPITSTLEEADRLIEISKRNGLVLQVGHLERFNPTVLGLDKLLTAPRYIETRRISPFRARGTDTNVVLDLMIHDIDLILNIVKAPISSIDAVGVPVLSHAEDLANVRIRFDDGCVATITASRVSWKTERTMRLFQPDAYIVLDLQQSKLSVTRRVGNGGEESQPILEQREQHFEAGGNLRRELESFLRCVEIGEPPLVTASDARRALAAALEITQQITSWRRDFA